MIYVKPEVELSAMYSLSETALKLQVSPSTIIRWTRAGLMRCQFRRINRRPVWSGEEIVKIWKTMI